MDYGMEQDDGHKGTYTIDGNSFAISITHVWDIDVINWIENDTTEEIPFTFDGTTLTMEIMPAREVEFTRLDLVQHADLAGTSWISAERTVDEEVMDLNSDGTYGYELDGYVASGTWEATNTLLRTITSSDSHEDTMYYENIYDYEINVDNELVLSWGETENYRFSLVE